MFRQRLYPDTATIAEERLRRALLTKIKLSHLRVFLEVARQESVSKSAVALRIAQPAISRTVRELENYLDAVLFERRPRGVVLTEVGQLVMRHVQAIFANLGRIGDDVALVKRGGIGAVSVGATMSALPYLLPQCLADPDLRATGGLVRVLEGSIDRMIDEIDSGEIDLVVGRVIPSGSNEFLEYDVVFEDPFVPVIGMNHPAATGAAYDLSELSKYPWIMPPFGSSAAKPLEYYMIQNDIRPLVRAVETVSYQTILRVLEITNHVAILPRHLAQISEKRQRLRIAGPPLTEGRLPIGITYRRNNELSSLASLFAETFRKAGKEVVRMSESAAAGVTWK